MEAGEQARHLGHREEAGEQALFAALAIGVHIGIVSGGATTQYVDVQASTAAGKLHYFDETRDLNPGGLRNLLAGDAGVVRDPKPLAESVWQTIWHATKAEPKECLLTFVEIFVLKFLSDNLPSARLPANNSFYRLIEEPTKFYERTGKTAIEYYVTDIRARLKTLFPDNVMTRDEHVPELFGLKTLVSKTSVINGFALLRSSQESLVSFDRTFREILDSFQPFGPLTAIDPEFKLRLYETSLAVTTAVRHPEVVQPAEVEAAAAHQARRSGQRFQHHGHLLVEQAVGDVRGRSHVIDALPDLVEEVLPQPLPAGDQRVDLGRPRAQHDGRHRSKGTLAGATRTWLKGLHSRGSPARIGWTTRYAEYAEVGEEAG